MAIILYRDFEDGAVGADLVNAAPRVTVTATNPHSGTNALQCASDGGPAEAIWRSVASLGAGRTELVFASWFRLPVRANFGRVSYTASADGEVCRYYWRSAGRLACAYGAGAEILGDPIADPAGWHLLEWAIDLAAGQHVARWMVDGAAQPDALTAAGVSASTITDSWVGTNAGLTTTHVYDDLAFAGSLADYPLSVTTLPPAVPAAPAGAGPVPHRSGFRPWSATRWGGW